MEQSGRFFVVGGAGFIGSHLVDALLAAPRVERVTIYDNFSSGREWHYAHHASEKRFGVVRGDVKELPRLREAMDGHDVVIHLASNPDIARAVTEPDVDFWDGTYLTHQVLEAMRLTTAKRILYPSGSGVYGELGTVEAHEDQGRMRPISTYGASKLAGEALISSYCCMFNLRGVAFRFGNVVGPRQTHGVGFDFVRRLRQDPRELRILGDGTQSKSYVYVEDIVRAVLIAHEKTREAYEVYNVATGDYITVREIADLACRCVGLDPSAVSYQFSGGDRGWKGDVPIMRLNTERIQSIGWRCQRSSAEALRVSISAMLADMESGKM